MHRCKALPAPIVQGDVFGNFQCPKNKYEIDRMKSVSYASAVGSLMYAQVCKRPDLAFTTGMLGRYQKNPGVEHWIAVKKALQYLQGTKSLMLTYRKSDALEIVGYSEADSAGCKDTRKSMSGYVFTLAGEPFRGRARNSQLLHRQQSTMSYEATGQALWLKKFVPGLKVVDSIEKPLKLYCDNEPAISYSYNNKLSNAAKYIDTKFYVVKEKVQDQTIIL
ncbi:hypothetical protein BS78_05G285900 [Paspalum vaginatum]|nr:hypothetical protein BS78_05G285900 [Paspalum vaginatum]